MSYVSVIPAMTAQPLVVPQITMHVNLLFRMPVVTTQAHIMSELTCALNSLQNGIQNFTYRILMIILFHDINATFNTAPYLFCDTSKPVKYQWQQDFISLSKNKTLPTNEEGQLVFDTLRNLLTFYVNRDNAQFKILARGKTLDRLFERYPELLI